MSGPRDAAGNLGPAVAPLRPHLRRHHLRAGGCFPPCVPCPAFLGSTRPRASAGRGGRGAVVHARNPRPRHSCRERLQSSAWSPRCRLGGPIPRTEARDTARGPERARVRLGERQEALSWNTGPGSTVVGALVRGLAKGGSRGGRAVAGRGRTHVAHAGGMARSRFDRRRRDAAPRVIATSAPPLLGAGENCPPHYPPHRSRTQLTIRCTPAMQAGTMPSALTVKDLVEMAA